MFNLDAIPINVRVIGFGCETYDAINQLRKLDYNGLSAEVFNKDQLPSVSSDDMMFILLVSDQYEDAIKCVKLFKEAQILTLAVCTEGIEMPMGCVDSKTTVCSSKMYATAKTILDMIFLPSMICLDRNDIDVMLRDSGQFDAIECTEYGINRVGNAMNQLKAESMMSTPQNVIVSLYFNSESTSPLMMYELQSVIEVANKLPRDNFFWTVSIDNSIADGAVRISLITTQGPMIAH